MAKIMVIDDSELATEMMQMILESEGHEVLCLNGALGATGQVSDFQPDLLFLDVNMPALSGDQLIELIRKNDKTKNTKVLLFSDREDSELRSLSDECGADGYMQKTSDQDEIINVVKSFCK